MIVKVAVCLCVCMLVCMLVCVRVCMCMCCKVCMYVCMYICTSVCVFVYVMFLGEIRWGQWASWATDESERSRVSLKQLRQCWMSFLWIPSILLHLWVGFIYLLTLFISFSPSHNILEQITVSGGSEIFRSQMLQNCNGSYVISIIIEH